MNSIKRYSLLIAISMVLSGVAVDKCQANHRVVEWTPDFTTGLWFLDKATKPFKQLQKDINLVTDILNEVGADEFFYVLSHYQSRPIFFGSTARLSAGYAQFIAEWKDNVEALRKIVKAGKGRLAVSADVAWYIWNMPEYKRVRMKEGLLDLVAFYTQSDKSMKDMHIFALISYYRAEYRTKAKLLKYFLIGRRKAGEAKVWFQDNWKPALFVAGGSVLTFGLLLGC